MIGLRRLTEIDSRLREAFPTVADQPFGGASILLVGDLRYSWYVLSKLIIDIHYCRQLPPVSDRPFYAQNISNPEFVKGRFLYKLFDDGTYRLTELVRQAGDENQQFREELERLANGTFSIDDWNRWLTQDYNQMDDERKAEFDDAVLLAAYKKDLVEYNRTKL